MNLLSELKIDSSGARVRKIAWHVLEHPETFEELMSCFLSEDYRIAQRASNVVNHCVESKNELVYPYINTIIEHLKKTVHDAVKRNSMRMFQFIDIPEEYLGEIAGLGFKYLDSEKEAVAIRVFSMTVLYNITRKFPGIKDELKMMIEDHLPYGTAGFKARAKKVLKDLERVG